MLIFIIPGKSASFLTANNLGVTKVSINPFAISGRIPSVRDFVISIVREIVKVQRKSSCRGEIIEINPRWIIARNVRLSWILRDTWVFSPHFSLSILKTQIPLVRALQTSPRAVRMPHQKHFTALEEECVFSACRGRSSSSRLLLLTLDFIVFVCHYGGKRGGGSNPQSQQHPRVQIRPLLVTHKHIKQTNKSPGEMVQTERPEEKWFFARHCRRRSIDGSSLGRLKVSSSGWTLEAPIPRSTFLFF